AFEAAYKHEQYITGRISKLTELAVVEKDHAAAAFLQWFVTEQVEEEASADQILRKLKSLKDAPGPLMMLDHKLGERKFSPPKEEAE
ncbi:MAG TPA: ferritin-like domain-containing protein, partial [Phycisphaerae bacterium]|nr:ferritin-like domain-containing protein [Phycisphaerae bacterium]